jgi:hypothetical protein
MPKDTSERIIDWPYNSGGSSASSGSGGGGGGSGTTNLDGLTDVTITAPADGNTLQYSAATGQWVNVVPAGGAGGAPSPHAHHSVHHNGLLPWAELDFTGSNLTSIVTRLHSDLQGITPNDHHNQVHVLATNSALGPDHTMSGAAAGQVLRATSATAAAFAQLQHTDLGNVLPDQHHAEVHVLATNSGLGPDHTMSGAAVGQVLRASSATAANFQALNHTDLVNVLPDQHHSRVHDIISGDASGPTHTISGPQWSVVGATATNTLGLWVATNAPGAAAALLRSDSNGGLQLDTNLLYVDGANNWVGINTAPSGAALDLRAAATAQITQRIHQLSGQTGRLWRVEDSTGNELIVMDSVGDLQSGHPGFVSGLTGWQITPGGNAEFNNIWARGELHATVFVKDEVHATGGTFLVATAATLYADANLQSGVTDTDTLYIQSATSGNSFAPLQVVTTSATFVGNNLTLEYIANTINVNDPPSGPALYFSGGEILRVKTEIDTGITDVWLEVMSGTQNSGYSSYSVVKRSGSDGVIPKGSAVVSYGQRGDGRILMTSDWRADQGYTPYIDVFTTGQNPWDSSDPQAIIPRMRMGQLSGVGVQGVSGISQWGMVASNDLTNTNSGYLVASNLGISLYKVPLILNNGSANTGSWLADGNLKVGNNIDTAAGTGFQVITTGSAAGDVIIGNQSSGAFLRWSQSAGTLTVVGSLTAVGGGSVDKTYVDTQDASTLSSAQSYANTTQSNAQTYSAQRRLTGVAGAWSASSGQITWATLTAQFSDGTSKSITANSVAVTPLPGGTGRVYLYVNVTLASPLTLASTNNAATINSPNYVLIAVCDPANNSAGIPSVSVVAAGTYISGGNIFTGSIQAEQIHGHTITANEIHAGAITLPALDPSISGHLQQALSISGSFTQVTLNVNNTVRWTGITVQKADGTSVTIADNGSGMTLSRPQTWFYILPGDANGVTVRTVDDTTFTTLQPNAIMIAYVSIGSNAPNIYMYGSGSTLSGGQIATQSITASQIAANTITASQIRGGTITSNEIDSSVYISAGGYQTMAVAGRLTPSASVGNVVTWSGVSVRKADGTTVNITDNTSGYTMAGSVGTRWYFYLDAGDSGTATLKQVSNPASLAGGAIMIAIVDIGANHANVIMVNGGVLISGEQIVSQSINTAQLAANSVTANQISVATLSAIQAYTGALTVSGTLTIGDGPSGANAGSIRSYGRTSPYPTSQPAGYYLGWDTSATPAYKWGIGDPNNFLLWDGVNLSMKTNQATQYQATADTTPILTFFDIAGHVGNLYVSADSPFTRQLLRYSGMVQADFAMQTPSISLTDTSGGGTSRNMITFAWNGNTRALGYTNTGILTYNGAFYPDNLTVNNNGVLIVTGNRVNIANSQSPVNSSAPGAVGDICWDNSFLYVRTTSGWRKITLGGPF